MVATNEKEFNNIIMTPMLVKLLNVYFEVYRTEEDDFGIEWRIGKDNEGKIIKIDYINFTLYDVNEKYRSRKQIIKKVLDNFFHEFTIDRLKSDKACYMVWIYHPLEGKAGTLLRQSRIKAVLEDKE